MDKELSDNEILEGALEEIGAVLTLSLAEIIGPTKDPLAQACLIIGREMGVNLTIVPEVSELQSVDAKLDLICSASQIRMRKVRLEENWWRQDFGPLLGFWKENQPVALLNRKHYTLINKQTVLNIDETVDADLSEEAITFYIPFDTHEKVGHQILKTISTYHLKNWKMAIPTVLIGILYALVPPIATKVLFQYAIPENFPTVVIYISLWLVFSAIGFALYNFLSGLLALGIKKQLSHFLQGALWDRLLRLPVQFFHNTSVGELSTCMLSLDKISETANAQTLKLGFTGFFAFFYFLAMLYFVPKLSLVILLVSVLCAGINLICSHLKAQVVGHFLALEGGVQGTLLHYIRGIAKLRTARAEHHAFAHWASLFAKMQTFRLKAKSLQNIAATCNHFLPIFCYFLIYLFVLEWFPIKTISLPNFLAFSIAMGSFCASFFPMNDALVLLVDIKPLWKKVKSIFDEPIEKSCYKQSVSKLKGCIVFKNVVFAYSPQTVNVLDGISLRIQPGEYIGIVGKSGSGKSTLLRLLLGIERAQSGTLFFDERDIQDLNLRWLRNQIGAVFQGAGMTFESISEAIWIANSSLDAMREAFEFAVIAEEIASLPLKIATPTNTLSGSQKDRLLLARAVLGNPPILVFDEPTASLDSKTRLIINENIRKRKETRIVATTRLENVKGADRIYVLDQGKITPYQPNT